MFGKYAENTCTNAHNAIDSMFVNMFLAGVVSFYDFKILDLAIHGDADDDNGADATWELDAVFGCLIVLQKSINLQNC